MSASDYPTPSDQAQPVTVLPYATSMAVQHDVSVWREGGTLIIRKGSPLPPTCVKCNSASDVRPHRVKLYWHSPFLYLLIFFPGLLIYAIVALIVRKMIDLNVGLCAQHRAARKRAGAMTAIAAVFGVACLVWGIVLAANSRNGDMTGTLIIIGSIVLVIGSAIYWSVVGRVLKPRKIDNEFAWITGACPDYLNQFPSTGR